MATSKAKRHTHKYHKVKIASDKVWACALPHCNHHMPKHMENLVVGKATLCWNCDEEFTLNVANMRDDKPQCDDCRGVTDLNKVIESFGKTEAELSIEKILDSAKGK